MDSIPLQCTPRRLQCKQVSMLHVSTNINMWLFMRPDQDIFEIAHVRRDRNISHLAIPQERVLYQARLLSPQLLLLPVSVRTPILH